MLSITLIQSLAVETFKSRKQYFYVGSTQENCSNYQNNSKERKAFLQVSRKLEIIIHLKSEILSFFTNFKGTHQRAKWNSNFVVL